MGGWEGIILSQPLVSIIIPAYNSLPLLKVCLDTVFRQDIADLGEMEVIVVDDGSSDGTWAWLQEILPEHPELHPIHLNDLGVAAARNTALEAATGTYVRFIDGDDALCEGSMRALLEPVLREHSDFAVGAFYRKIGDSQTVRNAGGADRTCSIEDYLELFTRYSSSYYIGVVWNKLFRRDLIEEAGIRFRGGMYYGEDFLFVNEYLAGCKRVSIVSHPVYVYYFNPRGMTIRQVKSIFTHPIKNIRLKGTLFRSYKTLFRRQGLYERYRLRVNLYPIKINFDQ